VCVAACWLVQAEAMLDKAEQQKLIESEQNEMIALMGMDVIVCFTQHIYCVFFCIFI
jgi:hypothetical protein